MLVPCGDRKRLHVLHNGIVFWYFMIFENSYVTRLWTLLAENLLVWSWKRYNPDVFIFMDVLWSQRTFLLK